MTKNEAFRDWQIAYGRLCTLVALALNDGHYPEHVAQAAYGKGNGHRKLRAHHDVHRDALATAFEAGVTREQVLERGLSIKAAVEQEWDLTLFLKTGA